MGARETVGLHSLRIRLPSLHDWLTTRLRPTGSLVHIGAMGENTVAAREPCQGPFFIWFSCPCVPFRAPWCRWMPLRAWHLAAFFPGGPEIAPSRLL